MDTLAHVIRQAETIRRRLWAQSTTWAGKFSTVLDALIGSGDVQVAGAGNAGIGHSFALMFLLAGVHGMKPIKGVPADEWMAKFNAEHGHESWNTKLKKLEGLVPHDYGTDFARPIYKAAMAASHSYDAADDLVAEVWSKFYAGAGEHLQPTSTGSAVGYVQKAIANTSSNQRAKLHGEKKLEDNTDEEGIVREVSDSKNLDKLMDEHNARHMVEVMFQDSALKNKLEHVHPDALQYLEAVTEGVGDVEFIGVNDKLEEVSKPIMHHPMLPEGKRMYPAAWNKRKQQMFDIIRRHFSDKAHHMHHASTYNYDRR
jgi:DNA-directed RNA polymerase specialized sigma24 family protein